MYFSVMNFDEIMCRACLSAVKEISIRFTESLARLYKIITDLEVKDGDGLPQQLCAECHELLHKYFTFREMCLSSEKSLKSFPSDLHAIKVEEVEKLEVKIEGESCTDEVDSGELHNLPKLEEEGTQYDDEDDLAIAKIALVKARLKEEKQLRRVSKRILKREKKELDDNKSGSHACGVCRAVAASRAELAAHVHAHRHERACGVCGAPCADWAALLAHGAGHAPPSASTAASTARARARCPLCGKACKDELYLEFHIRAVHCGLKEISCRSCGKVYSSARRLKAHAALVHRDPSLACPLCDKMFKTKQSLRVHVEFVHDKKKLVCGECGLHCNSHNGLKVHMARVHAVHAPQQQAAVFPCGLCELRFESEAACGRHVRAHDAAAGCALCGEPCADWPQLAAHRMLHTSTAPAGTATAHKSHRCPLCTRHYRSQPYMEFHIRSQHFGLKEISCGVCGRVYSSARKLTKHAWLHRQDKLSCLPCRRQFNTRQQLKIHNSFVHSEERKFVCDTCGDAFKSALQLKYHLAKRHSAEKRICERCTRIFPGAGELAAHACSDRATLVCPTCGKIFDSKRKFTHHRNSTHGSDERYKCARCPKAFKTPTAYKVHMNRHEGVRPHKCTYCSATFYGAGSLLKHTRIHTGERPYVCKICSKGFTGGHNLKVHMKVHGLLLVNKREPAPAPAPLPAPLYPQPPAPAPPGPAPVPAPAPAPSAH